MRTMSTLYHSEFGLLSLQTRTGFDRDRHLLTVEIEVCPHNHLLHNITPSPSRHKNRGGVGICSFWKESCIYGQARTTAAGGVRRRDDRHRHAVHVQPGMAASVPMDDGPSAAVPASWPTGTAGHRTSSGAARQDRPRPAASTRRRRGDHHRSRVVRRVVGRAPESPSACP
jgi:hypothetical protein